MTPAEQLNPAYWTPERIDRVRRTSARTFTMHVKNEFGGAENAVITKDELDACVAESLPPGLVMADAMCAIDSSALKRDGFCGLFAFFAHPDPTPRPQMAPGAGGFYIEQRDEYGYVVMQKVPKKTFLRVEEVFGFEPSRLRKLRIEDVIDHLAARCAAWGVRTVFADHFEQTALAGLLSQRGIRLKAYHWTEDSKADAIGGSLRRYVREGTFSIPSLAQPEVRKLYEELLSIREVPRAGQKWGYETGGKDFAAALISLFHGLADPDVVNVTVDPSVHVRGAPHQGYRGGRVLLPGRG